MFQKGRVSDSSVVHCRKSDLSTDRVESSKLDFLKVPNFRGYPSKVAELNQLVSVVYVHYNILWYGQSFLGHMLGKWFS